jgi:hypothetical protein
MRRTTVTENGKGENKDTDLRASIQRRRHNVVVLVEQVRMVLAQPPLGSKAQNEVAQDRGIDTYEQPAHVPQDDRQVEVGEDTLRPNLVGEPEREWDDESEQERQCHPLVPRAHGEHVPGNTPRDSQAVELVWGC